MTTDQNAAQNATPTDPVAPDPAVRASAAPYGVAPMTAAVAPRTTKSRRRRIVDAAIVSTTLATLPVAAAWNRAEEGSTGETLVEAVSRFDVSEDATTLRAATAALRTDPAEGTATTLAGPAPTIAAVAAPAPAGATAPAPAPAPDAPDAGPLTATPADVEEETPLMAAAAEATATEPTPIARVDDLEILNPSAHSVVVGFHEAAGGGTETMESMAPLAVALNGEGTAVAADAETDQVSPVMELPTRERGQAAASAVDIAVPAWRDIVAPVSGTVVTTDAYTLYGEFADNIVEIEPDGHPGLRVVMIHIGEVEVRPGDEVVAGETVVAKTAKQFPFASQIDRFAEEVSGKARPHVHMEVKRVG